MLIDSDSASASEIVAACLQDHGRAAVFGERSYGKGTVQTLIPTESGRSLLKLTSARYLRPSGKNIDRLGATEDNEWGVSPDPGREIPLSDQQLAAFAKYRSLRDLWGEPPPAELLREEEAEDDDAAASDSAAEVDFVDRPLKAAVEYLQGVFDAEKSS